VNIIVKYLAGIILGVVFLFFYKGLAIFITAFLGGLMISEGVGVLFGFLNDLIDIYEKIKLGQ
jgi:hypothetical protein